MSATRIAASLRTSLIDRPALAGRLAQARLAEATVQLRTRARNAAADYPFFKRGATMRVCSDDERDENGWCDRFDLDGDSGLRCQRAGHQDRSEFARCLRRS